MKDEALIEALCEAHDMQMTALHLGVSPYDEATDEYTEKPDYWDQYVEV